MKLFSTFIVATLISGLAFAKSAASTPPPAPQIEVPQENIQAGTKPSFDSANEMAKKISEGISSDKWEGLTDTFFPVEPFVPLKDVKDPAGYHAMLVKEFVASLKRQHEIYKATSLQFTSLVPGYCKWKAIGTEYNKIAYWSCYRNQIKAKDKNGKDVLIKMRAMINWGPKWYVVHL